MLDNSIFFLDKRPLGRPNSFALVPPTFCVLTLSSFGVQFGSEPNFSLNRQSDPPQNEGGPPLKHQLKPLALTSLKALLLTFLVFILPGWNSHSLLTAQVDPTKVSSEATASAAPTEPPTTDLPEPTKANTPATPEPLPTRDSGGIGIASGQWTYITENFEEPVFPAPGWTVQDLSGDGFERFWDDDNYRAHLGAWAAWPARGGANGLNPVSGNNNYFNNLNTRLIYGPFDLSDATQADTDFYLWRELEECCDYLAFELSHDGVHFQELQRWTTTDRVWRWKDVPYHNEVGDSSVWIAWRFYSDDSLTYDGPWIDDVHVWKFVPNLTTATPTRTMTRTPTRTRTLTRTLTPTVTRTPTHTPTPGPMIPRVYLPVIFKDYPPMKVKSGIHLGNRGSDWNTPVDFLARLRGTTQGDWPAAVVVLSNQMYDIQRNGPGCTVSNAEIRSPFVFAYLKQAAQAGTKVIIRLYPSPGNFEDAIITDKLHNLLYTPGETPENRDYCADPIPGDDPSKARGSDYFRAIDDLAREMNAIHSKNISQGWSEFAFEPANEPNQEWVRRTTAERIVHDVPQVEAIPARSADSPKRETGHGTIACRQRGQPGKPFTRGGTPRPGGTEQS